jgi:multiple sugar transport system permease protein
MTTDATAAGNATPVTRVARVVPLNRGGATMKRAENRAAYMFLIPWLIGIFGITLLPMLASLYLSFTS